LLADLDTHFTDNVALKGVRICVVAIEKQFVLHILSVCLLP